MDDVKYSRYRFHESSARIWRTRSRYWSSSNQLAFLHRKWSGKDRISSILNEWQSRTSEVLQTEIRIEWTEMCHISPERVSCYTLEWRFCANVLKSAEIPKSRTLESTLPYIRNDSSSTLSSIVQKLFRVFRSLCIGGRPSLCSQQDISIAELEKILL